jgi:hypothetical protein
MMDWQTVSRALNIIGVALMIVELAGLRDRVEAAFTKLREGTGLWARVGWSLLHPDNASVGLPIIMLLIWTPLAALQFLWPNAYEAILPALPVNAQSGVVDPVALALMIVVLVSLVWLVLFILSKFPKGVVGAVGAICAVASLVLDYV